MVNKNVLFGGLALALCVGGSVVASSYDSLQGSLAAVNTAPDLTVQDISIDSEGYLTVKVANLGNADVSSKLDGGTYIFIDGSEKKWTYSWSTLSDKDFMKAGDSSEIQPQVLTGSHIVKACVDPKRVVSESNEKNNCLAKALNSETTTGTDTSNSTGTGTSTETTTPGQTAYTDLAVDSISLDSRNILTVTVTNKGNTDLKSTLDGGTYIYLDSTTPKWTYSWSTLADTAFMTAGQSSKLQPQVLTGTHTVKACVDANNKVTESDEKNNCLEATVTAQ